MSKRVKTFRLADEIIVKIRRLVNEARRRGNKRASEAEIVAEAIEEKAERELTLKWNS